MQTVARMVGVWTVALVLAHQATLAGGLGGALHHDLSDRGTEQVESTKERGYCRCTDIFVHKNSNSHRLTVNGSAVQNCRAMLLDSAASGLLSNRPGFSGLRRTLVDDQLLAAVGKHLTQNNTEHLASIAIHHSKVTDQGLQAFLTTASGLHALEYFEVLDAEISGGGLALLPKFVAKRRHLRFLSLAKNAIRNEAAESIASAMQVGRLQSVHLGFNELGGGIKQLGHALARKAAGVRLLNLDANLISELDIKLFVEALGRDNAALKSVSLAHNDIGPFGMHSIGTLISNSRVESLNLANIGAGSAGMQMLGTHVRDSRYLRQLFLDDNRIGEEGAFTVATWIPRNGALAMLSLRNNGITNYGAKKLEQALASNGHITDLFLDGNPVSDAPTLEAISRYLQRNRLGRGPRNLDGGWSEWGTCDASCGHGMRRRWCTNPKPTGWGQLCEGQEDDAGPEVGQCYAGECPVDGGWSSWGVCTATCNTGFRLRACTNPQPSGGGQDCSNAEVKEPCNTQSCASTFESVDDIDQRIKAAKRHKDKFLRLQRADKVRWAEELLAQLEVARADALSGKRWQHKELQELEDQVKRHELTLQVHGIDGDTCVHVANAISSIAQLRQDWAATMTNISQPDTGVANTSSPAPALNSSASSLLLNLLSDRLTYGHHLAERQYIQAREVEQRIWQAKLQLIETAFPRTDALIANKTWAPELDEHVLQLQQLLAVMHDSQITVDAMTTVMQRADTIARAYCKGSPNIPFMTIEKVTSSSPRRSTSSCNNMFNGQKCTFECFGKMRPLAPLRCERGTFLVSATGCFAPENER